MRLPLARLLEDAIDYAEHGIVVTDSQAATTANKLAELSSQPGYAQTLLTDGAVPGAGSRFKQPRLAATLRHIANKGTDDFYRGELARSMAQDLARIGSPLTLDDLHSEPVSRVWRRHRAR